MSIRAKVEPLSWESDFFNISSGKIVFDPACGPLASSALDAFKVVQAKVAADAPAQVDALATLGFRLVEGEIDCSRSLAVEDPSAREPTPGVSSGSAAPRIAGAQDIQAARQLASSAFTLSRFREPWYRAPDCRRFYAVWAENAIHGAFDDLCLVIGPPGAIKGMVTLRSTSADEARIGLLAVQPGLGGRGIGRALFTAALAWCGQQQKSRLRVATQTGNLAALRLYIACGATIDGTAYWLYR